MNKVELIIDGKKILKAITFRKQKEFRRKAMLNRTNSELKAQNIIEKYFKLNKQFSVEFWFQFRRFDFFFPLIRTVIEIDGGYHSTEKQEKYDKITDEYLKSKHKIKVIRILNEDIESKLENICKELLKELLIKESNKALDKKNKVKHIKKQSKQKISKQKKHNNIYYKVIKSKQLKEKEIKPKVILRKANCNL